MGVEVIGVAGEVDGYGDSMEAFRTGHATNANILLNLAEGKKKNAPREPYVPDHPDNQWPVMVYHPAKGEKVIGVNLLGLNGTTRKQAEADNKTALAQSVKDGYRAQPYIKPQIAVLDPAVEKAAMLAKNQELEGKIVAQADDLAKLRAAFDKFLKA